MNAMVVQFDKNVFGKDAHEFRPDRWLESEERYWAMEKAMLVFGAGTRTCIGKHVSANPSSHIAYPTDVVKAVQHGDVQGCARDTPPLHCHHGPRSALEDTQRNFYHAEQCYL